MADPFMFLNTNVWMLWSLSRELGIDKIPWNQKVEVLKRKDPKNSLEGRFCHPLKESVSAYELVDAVVKTIWAYRYLLYSLVKSSFFLSSLLRIQLLEI